MDTGFSEMGGMWNFWFVAGSIGFEKDTGNGKEVLIERDCVFENLLFSILH